MYYCYTDSPIGELLLAGDGDALHCVGFPEGKMRRDPSPTGYSNKAPAAEATAQLAEYFSGDRTEFELPLAMSGTEFGSPYSKNSRAFPTAKPCRTRTSPNASDDPGPYVPSAQPTAGNPLPIFLPCHRVIGSGGDLTGFGGGLETKAALLRLEAENSQFPSVLPASEETSAPAR